MMNNPNRRVRLATAAFQDVDLDKSLTQTQIICDIWSDCSNLVRNGGVCRIIGDNFHRDSAQSANGRPATPWPSSENVAYERIPSLQEEFCNAEGYHRLPGTTNIQPPVANGDFPGQIPTREPTVPNVYGPMPNIEPEIPLGSGALLTETEPRQVYSNSRSGQSFGTRRREHPRYSSSSNSSHRGYHIQEQPPPVYERVAPTRQQVTSEEILYEDAESNEGLPSYYSDSSPPEYPRYFQEYHHALQARIRARARARDVGVQLAEIILADTEAERAAEREYERVAEMEAERENERIRAQAMAYMDGIG